MKEGVKGEKRGLPHNPASMGHEPWVVWNRHETVCLNGGKREWGAVRGQVHETRNCWATREKAKRHVELGKDWKRSKRREIKRG